MYAEISVLCIHRHTQLNQTKIESTIVSAKVSCYEHGTSDSSKTVVNYLVTLIENRH